MSHWTWCSDGLGAGSASARCWTSRGRAGPTRTTKGCTASPQLDPRGDRRGRRAGATPSRGLRGPQTGITLAASIPVMNADPCPLEVGAGETRGYARDVSKTPEDGEGSEPDRSTSDEAQASRPDLGCEPSKLPATEVYVTMPMLACGEPRRRRAAPPPVTATDRNSAGRLMDLPGRSAPAGPGPR